VSLDIPVITAAGGGIGSLALATTSATSAVGGLTGGDTLAGVSAGGAIAKVPSELFRTLGAAARCGDCAQAATASRVRARSE
jgi:hypothetical protein